ncbi:MAG: GNAT family N-acetyltransferase [Pseudomonadota bacterium]
MDTGVDFVSSALAPNPAILRRSSSAPGDAGDRRATGKAVLGDHDILTFRRTHVSDYRRPFAFVEALNDGTLFGRPARVFQAAARESCLFEVVVGKDQRIVATGILQDHLEAGADGPCREKELGGLMVHPDARGLGIVTLLIKLMLAHRWAAFGGHHHETYVARVVDGNPGAARVLQAVGFRSTGYLRLYPGQFDGSIEHMMAPGEDFVRMEGFRFEPEALDEIVHDLWTFWQGSRALGHSDRGQHLAVDFADLVAPSLLTDPVLPTACATPAGHMAA